MEVLVIRLSHRCASRRVVALLVLVALALLVSSATAFAATEVDVVRVLERQDAYIDSSMNHPGDLQRLEQAAGNAASQGVPEKLVVLSGIPSGVPSSAAAASSLRRLLNFSGVVVVADPRGIGLSSDRLSRSEMNTIGRKAVAQCITGAVADCAVLAGNDAVSQIKADKSASDRRSAIFWGVVLIIIAVVVAFLVWNVGRRRKAITGRRNDLYAAASNTLSLADNAVEQIESATTGQQMPAGARADYDRALALRDQARNELDRAQSPEMLTQANQDAAQAVLALQGVMKTLGISSPLANPLEAPTRRCFYCGHDDRPPYSKEVIDDGRGNSMQVDVCNVCRTQMAEGRRPQVSTVNYGGAMMPWWAVPGNPWYYSYGGPSWQNWLPFFAGVELGSFFGGGWGYGDYDDRGWGGDDGGQWGGDAGQAVGADAPSDAGGVDFSGQGGWDASGGDTGGWDSGGGDWGGGDSGGGGGGDW